MAFGLFGVEQAVVEGAPVPVRERVTQQADDGVRVGDVASQGPAGWGGWGVEEGVHPIQALVAAVGSGTGRDGTARDTGGEELGQAAGRGVGEVVVELAGPRRIRLGVAVEAVGQGAVGGVFELQAQGDFGVGFARGEHAHGAAEHVRPHRGHRDGFEAGVVGGGVDVGDERVDAVAT
ncbi:hypothetical protein [Embleya sp. NPDC005971]|uniref:hypothetical protein n=1 Tax=Embleya sp. NPDC005971 TaxID=3156724 RepID=UPI0033CF59BE